MNSKNLCLVNPEPTGSIIVGVTGIFCRGWGGEYCILILYVLNLNV